MGQGLPMGPPTLERTAFYWCFSDFRICASAVAHAGTFRFDVKIQQALGHGATIIINIIPPLVHHSSTWIGGRRVGISRFDGDCFCWVGVANAHHVLVAM